MLPGELTNIAELSKIDAAIFRLGVERNKLEEKLKNQEQTIKLHESKHLLLEQDLIARKTKQEDEDKRIKLEHVKLAERRKATASLANYKLQEKANREIDYASKLISIHEENLINSWQDIDSFQLKVNESQQKLALLREQFEQLVKDYELNLVNMEERLVTHQNSKSELLNKISIESISLYQKVNERYPTDTVVILLDTTCTGCFLDVGRQTLQMISKQEALVRCRGCARILVLP